MRWHVIALPFLLSFQTGPGSVAQPGTVVIDHSERIMALCFSTDGKRLFAVDSQFKMLAWTLKSQERVLEKQLDESEVGLSGVIVSLAHTGKKLNLVTGRGLFEMDLESTQMKVVNVPKPEASLCSYAQTDKQIFFGTGTGEVLWGSRDGKLNRKRITEGDLTSLQPHRVDARDVLLLSGAFGNSVLFDVKEQKATPLTEPEERIVFACSSPQNELVAFTARGDYWSVNPRTAKTAKLGNFVFEGSLTASLPLDKERYIFGTTEGALVLFSLKSKEARREEGRHKGLVRALAKSPDGKWIASGGRDKRIVVTPTARLASE